MSEKSIEDQNQGETQQQSSSVKTHDEIIELLNDLEQYEQDIDESLSSLPSLTDFNEEQLSVGELTPETTQQEITPPKQETKPKLHLRWRKKIKEQKEPRKNKLFSRKPKQPKDKISFKRRLYTAITGSEEPLSTFSLHLDEKGQLSGFNIKDPSPSFREVFSLFRSKLKKRLSKPSKDGGDKTGVVGKITGIFRRGKSGEKESSEKSGKFSGLTSKLGKIKNVIPKRNKGE